ESGGLIDEHFTEHHVAKARGGTAWIGSETWPLNSPLPPGAEQEFGEGGAALAFAPYMFPGFVDAVRKFCDAVHAEGAVAIFQLTHLNNAFGASTVPTVELYDLVPHAMTEEHIEFVMDTYVEAAKKALEAGADGLEIHCAHETVPQSFLSPATNKRDDKWGGDAEGRTLFVREALTRIRAVIGDKLALGLRINGEESRQGGYDLLQFREMVYIIAETGLIDFVNVDVGHCWGRHAYVPPSYHNPAEHREAGKAIRTDLPESVKILFSGRVNEPIVAEELLAAGICDLVGMTRAGIADPEFPNKILEGRLLEMRRCIGCNRCISEAVHSKKPGPFKRPVCSINPEIGQEVLWKETFKPAEVKKHVAVIGAGPAGLEAARIATLRGHRVTLIEKGRKVGGQLLLAAKAPGRDSFEDYLYFSENEIERLGIDLMLETEATPEFLLELKPDVVVCSTGSEARSPAEVEGAESSNVVQGWDVLAGKATVGDKVALYSEDDYFETPNIAEALAVKGKQVTIFHKWAQIGKEIDRYSFGTVMKRLEENNVEIVGGVRLSKVDGDKVHFISAYSGAERVFEGFDSVVLVCGSTPNADLYYKLKDNYPFEKGYLVGSAWLPRRLAEATKHGATIGLEI
ncbi:MAG: FAD-dependent oxidoreductase, partial [Gammaproteobacteria bacterium]|nr:FAD-dependent oxidoreductase [Gammaproteobacteria bacterium]